MIKIYPLKKTRQNYHYFFSILIKLKKAIKEFHVDLYYCIKRSIYNIPHWIEEKRYDQKTIKINKNYSPHFSMKKRHKNWHKSVGKFMMDICPLIADTFNACHRERSYIEEYCHIMSFLPNIEGFEFFGLIYLDQEHFDLFKWLNGKSIRFNN